MTARLPLRILSGFWAAAVAITLLGAWSISHMKVILPIYAGPHHAWPGLLDMWTRYDAGWYQYIVTNGYFYQPPLQSSIVFFPTYPLVVRPLYALGVNPYLAGSIVTMVASSVAIVAFIGWQRDYRYAADAPAASRSAITIATLAWLVYPYSYYLYGSMYGDALFIAIAVSAFWLLERDHPVLAGIVGIAATAGRPFGWAVTLGLAVRAVERRWRDAHHEELAFSTVLRHPVRVLRCVKPVDLTVGISGFGVLAWLSFLWIRFGSPWVFIKGEQAWGQGSSREVLLKTAFWDILFRPWEPSRMQVLTLIAQAVIGIGLVTVGSVLVYRRFGLGMAVYVVFTMLPPVLFSKDFQGIGRYALSAFPVFAVAGLRISPFVRWSRLALVGSGLAMVYLATLYARGYYLA